MQGGTSEADGRNEDSCRLSDNNHKLCSIIISFDKYDHFATNQVDKLLN